MVVFHMEFWFLNTFYLFDLTLTYGQPVITYGQPVIPSTKYKEKLIRTKYRNYRVQSHYQGNKAEPFHCLSAPPVAFDDMCPVDSHTPSFS